MNNYIRNLRARIHNQFNNIMRDKNPLPKEEIQKTIELIENLTQTDSKEKFHILINIIDGLNATLFNQNNQTQLGETLKKIAQNKFLGKEWKFFASIDLDTMKILLTQPKNDNTSWRTCPICKSENFIPEEQKSQVCFECQNLFIL